MTDKKPPEQTATTSNTESSNASSDSRDNKKVIPGPSASIILSSNTSDDSAKSSRNTSSSKQNTPSSAGTEPITETAATSAKSSSSAASNKSQKIMPKNTPSLDKKAETKVDTKPEAKTPNTAGKSPVSAAKGQNTAKRQPLSKTALLALFIALLASAGVGGLFYWNQQQQLTFEQKLLNESQQLSQENQQKIQQLLTRQQQSFAQQLAENEAKLLSANQDKITQLENAIAKLGQNEPTDWLLHEAEYLVRIAGRTLWLEHDTKAAINLLQDADTRLQELNNPELLPVRQLIHQDIEQLKLMPVLDSEAVILQIMAVAKQVDSLILAMVDIPESEQVSEELQLSDNASDWQVNLKKTWQKFLDDFITVRRRTGNVEPLMSPDHQQNLRENLKLKLQVVQWAVSEEKAEVYLASLNDISQWLATYYDMENLSNQNFSMAIDDLKAKQISFDYPSQLTSLKALRRLMNQQPSSYVAPTPAAVENQPANEPAEAIQESNNNDEGVL